MDSGKRPRDAAGIRGPRSGGIELDRDRLSIVWFEEGDAAFLFEGERMIAAIPGWAGEVPGVLLFAKGGWTFAWELKNGPSGAVFEGRPQPALLGGYGDYFRSFQGETMCGAGRLFRAPPAVFPMMREFPLGAGHRGEGREPLRLPLLETARCPAEDEAIFQEDCGNTARQFG